MSKSFQILINKHAGTVQERGEETLRQVVNGSNLNVESLDFLEPEKLFNKLQNLKSHDQKNILIGGGDGTVRSASEILKQRSYPFGILPLGTMNLLARDLGMPITFDDAIEAYAQGYNALKIDLGVLNDKHVFLCCAALGAIPAASEVREEMRKNDQMFIVPQLTAYVLSQIDRRHRKMMNMTMDSAVRSIKTAALVVSNNQYTPQQSWDNRNFRRDSLQDGKLGIYSAAPYSLWDKVRMITNLKLGNWKDDPAITEWLSTKLAINTNRKTELISLDGEPQEIQTPLHFSIKPKALELLVPGEAA